MKVISETVSKIGCQLIHVIGVDHLKTKLGLDISLNRVILTETTLVTKRIPWRQLVVNFCVAMCRKWKWQSSAREGMAQRHCDIKTVKVESLLTPSFIISILTFAIAAMTMKRHSWTAKTLVDVILP